MARPCIECFLPVRRSRALRCQPCGAIVLRAQLRAHAAVHAMVLAGQLPDPKTLPCADCERRAFCYDHRDYSQPLKVDAVCRSCNRNRGPAMTKKQQIKLKKDKPVSTDDLVVLAGGTKQGIADLFGVTRQAVSSWGTTLPALRVYQLRELRPRWFEK